jgi:hypothetical protein
MGLCRGDGDVQRGGGFRDVLAHDQPMTQT